MPANPVHTHKLNPDLLLTLLLTFLLLLLLLQSNGTSKINLLTVLNHKEIKPVHIAGIGPNNLNRKWITSYSDY